MAETTKTGSAVRKFITGTVAAGALLVLYGVGMVSVTGAAAGSAGAPSPATQRRQVKVLCGTPVFRRAVCVSLEHDPEKCE